MQKLYCYVDETGQDTKGRFFLVSILISDKTRLAEVRERIRDIERGTKGRAKWTKTNNKKKTEFIKRVLSIKLLRGCLFYSIYQNTTAYTPLVAMSVGKAVIYKTKKSRDNYKVNIVIDALRKSDKNIISRELKNLNIKYNVIKVGLRDEQEVLLRLVDALAGFVRDYLENKKYTADLLNKESFKRFFREI